MGKGGVGLSPVTFGTLLPWLVLIAFFLTAYFVWVTMRNVMVLRHSLVGSGAPARNREELEERYVAGSINRDMYERWKDRLQ